MLETLTAFSSSNKTSPDLLKSVPSINKIAADHILVTNPCKVKGGERERGREGGRDEEDEARIGGEGHIN